MPRECVAPSHWGHHNQIVEAVDRLGPRQQKAFDKAFPEWPAYRRDPYDDTIDPEVCSWVADWIEEHTKMYWEDGELWTR